jgi:hypothetical protein
MCRLVRRIWGAYVHDHEGFSFPEGFSFNKRKILRDHGMGLALRRT